MTEPIRQLAIRDLLDGRADYLIPMYQRNYAWGQAEIEQLIQDIRDSQPLAGKAARPYYIGTLVVFRKPDDAFGHPVYEVIDGQQRLTTLFLLAAYFKKEASKQAGVLHYDMQWLKRQCLSFESRPHSLATLNALFAGKDKTPATGGQPDAANSNSIRAGYENIRSLLGAARDPLRQSIRQLSEFAAQLFEHTHIMCVQVPADTDLNHYFEIMNNRGEQLEKHEVLKALLMSRLNESGSGPEAKAWLRTLSRVWDACANMERYVQMGFTPAYRHSLFGHNDWSRLLPENFDALNDRLVHIDSLEDANSAAEEASDKSILLSELIRSPFNPETSRQSTSSAKEDAPERFGTVINFPNFLLQVLRATTGRDIPLDDKNLISAFKEALLQHSDAGARIKQFIYDLLKCKFLYDQYIIKREHLGGEEGWSLKRLIWRAGSADYVNTFGTENDNPAQNRRILMLLSALHVSNPTLVYKHWLNAALHYLCQARDITSDAYLQHMESIARCFMYDRFLSRHADADAADYYEIIYGRKGALQAHDWETDIDETRLTFGNIANNLVFNYLDYLLWLKQGSASASFHFTFRSSVEHYYPQNPRFDIPPLPPEILDSFGNLCLVSHSKNSSMSNHTPAAKRDYYKPGKEDSLKQGLMMWETAEWTADSIKAHHQAMLNILREDLQKNV